MNNRVSDVITGGILGVNSTSGVESLYGSHPGRPNSPHTDMPKFERYLERVGRIF